MQLYLQSLFLILTIMTILWVISIFLKNVSIADLFWGTGFVIVNIFYSAKFSSIASQVKVTDQEIGSLPPLSKERASKPFNFRF